jgi:hypothetical protein
VIRGEWIAKKKGRRKMKISLKVRFFFAGGAWEALRVARMASEGTAKYSEYA